MEKLRLALFALVGLFFASVAHAACPLPLTAKDSAGTIQSFGTENDENNNCDDDVSLTRAHTYNATLQSSAVASGNGTAFTVTGTGGAALTVNCSACSGGTTVNFEGQEDGSNFRPIQASPSDGTAPSTTTTTAGVTDWFVSTTGLQQIRARISGYSAGTVTVTAHAFAVPLALPSQTVFQGTSPWVTNITQFGGSNVATGTGAGGSGIPRVTISNDSSLAANQSVNNNQWGGTNVVTGGVAGTVGVGGLAANGATTSGNLLQDGGRAQNAEITAVTNGQQVAAAYDLVGKVIVMPYANKENFLSGDSGAVTTPTNTQLIAAQAAGIKIYVHGLSCTNTGTTTSLVQLTNGSGGSTLLTATNPAGSGVEVGNISGQIATGAATALFLKTGSASTSQECTVWGWKGT